MKSCYLLENLYVDDFLRPFPGPLTVFLPPKKLMVKGLLIPSPTHQIGDPRFTADAYLSVACLPASLPAYIKSTEIRQALCLENQ